MMPAYFLGWSRGRNKSGDETGIWHAVIVVQTEAGEVSRVACSRQQLVAGQVESLPEGAHVCKRIGCDNLRMKGSR